MILFGIAVFVAFLTTFYMTRAYVVAFLGKTRSENADHAHEVGPLMWIPLVILAGMAIGSAWLTGPLSAIDPRVHAHGHIEGHFIILGASITALLFGLASGFVLYSGKDKDPLSIPLLKNRFYIDGFYDNFIVRYFQDAFSAIIAFFDEILINGLLVGGLSRAAESSGNLFRKVQSGSLQGYAFAFGLGVILVVYFTTF
jgi:NADH-quinone oxidoreductase subunit L